MFRQTTRAQNLNYYIKKNNRLPLTITGIQRPQHTQDKKRSKLLWMPVVLSISCLCVYHIGTMVRTYINNPVITRMMLEEQDYVLFPFVTICSPSSHNIFNLVLKDEELKTFLEQAFLYSDYKNDMTKLWNEGFSTKVSDFELYTSASMHSVI